MSSDVFQGYGFSLEHLDLGLALDYCKETGYQLDLTPEPHLVFNETSLRILWNCAGNLPEGNWQRVSGSEDMTGAIICDNPEVLPGMKALAKYLEIPRKDVGIVTYDENGIIDVEKAVIRTYYQDPYNEKKVWEVSDVEHGFYLRQFIGNRQFGTGERVSKAELDSLGISNYEVLKVKASAKSGPNRSLDL